MLMNNIGSANKILTLLCTALLCFSAVSCEKSNDEEPEEENLRTLFLYMPWSTNLTEDFRKNISDMEKSISSNGLKSEKVIVFLSTSSSEAEMFELYYSNGNCGRKPLKEYDNPAFTTAAGIASVLNDVKAFAPAKSYSMVIGCHGMGWIPVNRTRGVTTTGNKMHWDYEGVPKTRFFGGMTTEYQTDISTLADGIKHAGMKMEYILFDDCYMSSIEVAYELKDVTDYLIGSTSEIMAYGMPYATMGKYLLGTPDYQAICNEFHEFYSSYSLMPCGTIAVTYCPELDNMARIMKEINSRYSFDGSLTDELQRLDGYTPTLFFDFGDYVAHLCTDPALLQEFESQLTRTVPYKAHTDKFYSMVSGTTTPINTFSGITTSDPSVNTLADSKTNTLWYAATH